MLAFALLTVVRAAAQDASKVVLSPQEGGGKQPSSSARAQCKFSDGKTITVNYSSPRVRGRKIFGDLVPYGQVGRTGANEATTFVTDEDLITVKGTSVPAGSYTILTVPNPDRWTLIINKNTAYETGELARVPMSVTKVSSPVENFTVSFEHTGGSCMMHMNWENTRASLEFTEKNTDLPLTD